MEQQSENRFIELDLKHYLRIFRNKWWFLVLMTVICLGLGFAYSQVTPPIYRANATLLIDSSASTTSQGGLVDLRADEVRTLTYSQLIVQRSVLEEAIDTLNLSTNVSRLRSQVSVSPIPGTQLIRITVERDNPETAAILTNVIGETFIRQYAEIQSANYAQLRNELNEQLEELDLLIQETNNNIQELRSSIDPVDVAERNRLENIQAQYRQSFATIFQSYEQVRLSEFNSTTNITVSEQAIIPGGPVWPQFSLILMLSGLGGLILAAVIVLIQDYMDDSVKSADLIQNRFGLPVIAQIGHFDAEQQPLVTFHHPRSPSAEAFRNMRMNLKYLAVDHNLKTILVTSANESEGKSTVAANLAVVLARGGQNTILLDGDLRLPKVNRLFNLSNNRGFSELFIDSNLDYKTILHQSQVDGLSILTSGAPPPNPSELLDTKRARDIVGTLTQNTDVVVIDSPPLLAVTDAMALSQYVDGVILMVRVASTKMGMLKTAIDRLRRVDANLMGIIMIDIDGKAAAFDDYYFSYGEYTAYKVAAEDIQTPKNPNGYHSTEEKKVTE
jgi:capsular exopolysaccharide synthesis family protein